MKKQETRQPKEIQEEKRIHKGQQPNPPGIHNPGGVASAQQPVDQTQH